MTHPVRDENPYESPEIIHAEFSPETKRPHRHVWHWSYGVGLLVALFLSLAMPEGIGKTEYVVFLGILAIALWIWTWF